MDTPSPHEQRRRFIVKTVNEKGFVTKQELQDEGYEFVAKDAEFFKKYFIAIEAHKDMFISTSPTARRWTYEMRKDQDTEKKKPIGQLAAAILAGSSKQYWKLDVLEQVGNQIVADAKTRKTRETAVEAAGKELSRINANLAADGLSGEILKQLQNPPDETIALRKTAKFLQDFLDGYFKKEHRHIVLDSGTTTEAIARCLVDVAPGRFANIRVLTNAPRIEAILDEPRVPIDVIGLGGALRKDTLARTGYLSELCLNAWNFRADITAVGTTSLRFDDKNRPRGFACDSESEAVTKSMFLSLATAKFVVMDSSKCHKVASSSFQFCESTADSVHMIITVSLRQGCPTLGQESASVVVFHFPVEDTTCVVESVSKCQHPFRVWRSVSSLGEKRVR